MTPRGQLLIDRMKHQAADTRKIARYLRMKREIDVMEDLQESGAKVGYICEGRLFVRVKNGVISGFKL